MSTIHIITPESLLGELGFNWLTLATEKWLSSVSCVLQNMPSSYGSDVAFDGQSMDHEEFTLLNTDEYQIVVEFLQNRIRVMEEAGQKLPIIGQCSACGSIEVHLVGNVLRTMDLSTMGESPRYPVGYGCELCA